MAVCPVARVTNRPTDRELMRRYMHARRFDGRPPVFERRRAAGAAQNSKAVRPHFCRRMARPQPSQPYCRVLQKTVGHLRFPRNGLLVTTGFDRPHSFSSISSIFFERMTRLWLLMSNMLVMGRSRSVINIITAENEMASVKVAIGLRRPINPAW